MRVVQAQIQTAEEIYRPVWTAVGKKQPIEATYQGGIDCFVCTDWAGIGKGGFACSVTNTAAKAGADSRRSVGLQTGVVSRWSRLSRVKLLDHRWHTPPNHSRPASCVTEADIDAEDHPGRDPQKGH
jgi:hypothetical protein